MAFRMIVTPRGADGVKARIFSMYKDATAEFMLCLNATDINFGKQVGSQWADVYLYSADYNKKGVPVELIFIHTASYGMALCARRYTTNEWSPWTTAPVNNAANAKTDCVLASNYVLGVRGAGGWPLVGNINLFDTLLIPTGITDPLAWAKSQWGIA